jgi:hypothetical protein
MSCESKKKDGIETHSKKGCDTNGNSLENGTEHKHSVKGQSSDQDRYEPSRVNAEALLNSINRRKHSLTVYHTETPGLVTLITTLHYYYPRT